LEVQEAQEYYKLVLLNILCVTQFVTSSVTVLETAIMRKIGVNDSLNQKS